MEKTPPTKDEQRKARNEAALKSAYDAALGLELAPGANEYFGEITPFVSIRNSLIEAGDQDGEFVGWKSLAPFYRPCRGQWTVVFGVPGHGKTSWMDCLMLNLISSAHWKFAVFSAENKPLRRHAKSLVTRYSGIPWGRISEAEIDFALSKLSQSLFILDPTDDHLSLDYLLEMTRFLIDREQVDGLILDPWNEIDHSGRGQFQSETEYISQSLTKIRRFARNHDIHIWVVAHPQKLYRDKEGHFPVPGLYDITGSAAWRNKCDFGICVWRDMQNRSKPTEIHIQKVRFSENGKTGDVPLQFDVFTGRYFDLDEFTNQEELPR